MNEQDALGDSELDSRSIASLAWLFITTLRLKGQEYDRLRGYDVIRKRVSSLNSLAGFTEDPLELVSTESWFEPLKGIAHETGVEVCELHDAPDPARLPMVTWVAGKGWGIIRSISPQNTWIVDFNGRVEQIPATNALPAVRLDMRQTPEAISKKPVFAIFHKLFLSSKKEFIEAGLSSIVINLLAVMVSLYSMQVYDRVIPTQGYSTLSVLTIGVFITLIFDLAIKVVRGHILEHVQERMDQNLSRELFSRLLKIRMDQLPPSVGSLSAQIRGYETIRAFISSSTFYLLVDAPFGIIFALIIALVASPVAALVPVIFFFVAVGIGLVVKQKIDHHVTQATAASNKKTGLLVEAIEGAETIKSGAGGWSILSKWLNITEESLQHEMALKRISEKANYLTGVLQQVSYVLLICVGAYLAAEGQITQGAVIAASILSGRVLAPIAQIPGMIIQASHSKTALALLEKLYTLEVDNHDVRRPLIPESLEGAYRFDYVRFAYPGSNRGLTVKSLSIRPGDKIGVIGPVGSGKSTFLRLLSGMYRATEGRILLDGLDVEQISRHFIAEKIGYLQQSHRLFSGTLRENLLIGLTDPGDDAIKEACMRTGLNTYIASSPKGLETLIPEGGQGLSGGQTQLVAITRTLLRKPTIWLLDEPTASLDQQTEDRCRQALVESISQADTLILVTHKPALLSLVDRLIIIANDTIVMDGPRDQVLKQLSENQASSQQANGATAT